MEQQSCEGEHSRSVRDSRSVRRFGKMEFSYLGDWGGNDRTNTKSPALLRNLYISGRREVRQLRRRGSSVPMTVPAIYMQVHGVAQECERRKGLLETAAPLCIRKHWPPFCSMKTFLSASKSVSRSCLGSSAPEPPSGPRTLPHFLSFTRWVLCEVTFSACLMHGCSPLLRPGVRKLHMEPVHPRAPGPGLVAATCKCSRKIC